MTVAWLQLRLEPVPVLGHFLAGLVATYNWKGDLVAGLDRQTQCASHPQDQSFGLIQMLGKSASLPFSICSAIKASRSCCSGPSSR